MIHRRFKSLSLSLALVLALAPGTPANAVQAAISHYALPAMPLGDALREVSRQSGQNLLVDDRLVAGRTAPPLSGSYSAEAAVASLLAGSGLTGRSVDGTLIITATATSLADQGDPAPAQDQEVIIVTGTNVRGAQPTSPVISISRREIDQAAPASVEEFLRKLPQNSSSGVVQENFGVSGAGADITDHGAGVNLRGLGQRATLTLINGHRVAPSGSGSFVDISLIPISAVQRIEIVTDGASAIYGSDAVGGVINFLLRDDFEGLETLVQAGSATKGDGDQLLLGATAGHRWGGGHALLSYEFRAEDGIRAGDRSYTDLPDDWLLFPRERRHSMFGNLSQSLGSGLTLDLTGQFAHRDTTRNYFITGGTVEVDATARSRSIGGTAALRWDMGGSWTSEAILSHYDTRTHQVQIQPGANGLVNRYNTQNRLTDAELKATGDLFALPGGPIKLAVGAQIRRERFDDLFETLVNSPNPQSGHRTVKSAYVEAFVPIFGKGNALPGIQRLAVTAAARVDDYGKIGTSVDPKIGLLWSPVAGLNLRSSYSTSFRAPLLSETLGYYNAYLFPASLVTIDPADSTPGVAAALIGANPGVEPERSRSWTAGADWTPPSLPGLRLTATYYRIRFSNRIALPTEQIVVVGNPALEPIVTRNPDAGVVGSILDGAGQVLDFSGPGFSNGGATPADVVLIVDARISNTAETHTSGLDLGAHYDFERGRHRFTLDANANRIFEFTNRLTSASPVILTLNTPFNPIKWRARGSLGWAYRGASASLAVNFTDSYRDRRASLDRPVDSFTTVDAGFAYEFGPVAAGLAHGLRLSFNAANLFDARPPRLEAIPGLSRGIGYDPVNASGRGRTVSVQLRKAW